MKKIWSLAALLLLVFQSCLKDNVSRKTTIYKPVYKTKDEVRANIKSSTPVELTAPGKIFYKDGYIFLNELNKGVHIIDVRNTASPKNIAFVNIPGAADMAVIISSLLIPHAKYSPSSNTVSTGCQSTIIFPVSLSKLG